MKISRNFLLAILIISFSGFLTANAASLTDEQSEKFKNIYELQIPSLEFPKAVETIIPIKQEHNVVVVEKKTKEIQAIEMLTEYKNDKANLKITNSSEIIGDLNALFDGEFDSTLEFNLDKDNGQAYIELSFDKEISLSSFSLFLDKNVFLPYAVKVEAYVENNWKTVLNTTPLTYFDVNFPTTNAKKWRIEFWHSQPLRIKEISFYNEGKDISFKGEKIIWLAKSNTSYLIYSDAISYVNVETPEKPNLLGEKNKLSLDIGEKITNVNYKEADYDSDGIADFKDNCIYHANKNQEDLDKNKVGDICDDHDLDGILNIEDNCPNDTNRYQKDTDNDKIGDACDSEESRVTEKFTWLPWVIIAIAAGIVTIIILQTISSKKN